MWPIIETVAQEIFWPQVFSLIYCQHVQKFLVICPWVYHLHVQKLSVLGPWVNCLSVQVFAVVLYSTSELTVYVSRNSLRYVKEVSVYMSRSFFCKSTSRGSRENCLHVQDFSVICPWVKGTVSWDFSSRFFFHKTTAPGALINYLKYFRIWL